MYFCTKPCTIIFISGKIKDMLCSCFLEGLKIWYTICTHNLGSDKKMVFFKNPHNQLNEMRKIIQDIKVELYKEIESLNKNPN